jgi:hypothetical protein
LSVSAETTIFGGIIYESWSTIANPVVFMC